MAQHRNYWSCSKFANWLRGTDKLKAGTGDEWEDWREQAQKQHPIRYWLAEEGLDYLQDAVTWPIRKIYDAKYYINNRWVTRTHALTAHPRDLPRGQWCDVGNRFLPCLFNELAEFVEVEKAWMMIACDEEAAKKYKPPFWAKGWFRWRTWRSAEAGLAHLDWEMNLTVDENWGVDRDSEEFGKPTYQAINAKEIYDLYIWWTTVYPNRPDPYDVSGWTEYCEKLRERNGGRLFGSKTTPELEEMSNQAHNTLKEIEEQYEAEDEAMMIRLIKVRNSLWT